MNSTRTFTIRINSTRNLSPISWDRLAIRLLKAAVGKSKSKIALLITEKAVTRADHNGISHHP